jgi:hypothetical protein
MYTVGDAPANAILEGGNVWVANFGSRTVTKLRAIDGAVLGTYGQTSLQ